MVGNWLEFGTLSESHAHLSSMLLVISPYCSKRALAFMIPISIELLEMHKKGVEGFEQNVVKKIC